MLEKQEHWTVFKLKREGASEVLAANFAGRERCLEDPEDPGAEMLDTLGDRLLDVRVLVTTVCSPDTFKTLISKTSGLRLVLLVDDNRERLDLWSEWGLEVGFPVIKSLLLPEDRVEATALIKKEMNRYAAELFLGLSAVYLPRRFKRVEPGFSEFLENTVLHIQQEALSAAAHKTTRSWHRALNQICNSRLKSLCEFKLSELNKEGSTVVVVGAGPSLDRNISILRENQDRATIIATDASLTPLLSNGIRPDLIATLEDTSVTWRFFVNHLSKLNDIPLVSPIHVTSAVAVRYPGPIVFYKGIEDEHTWPESLTESLPKLEFGQCVGHFAFHIASSFKPERILLIGFDFAYQDDKTHASGMNVEIDESYKKKFTRMKVPGALGGEVGTDLSMYLYLKYMEENLSSCPVPVYDATEGGALISGAEPRRLIDCLYSNSQKVNLTLMESEARVSFKSSEEFQELKNKIDDFQKKLHDISEETERMSVAKWRNPIIVSEFNPNVYKLICQCSSLLVMADFTEYLASDTGRDFNTFLDKLKRLISEFRMAANYLHAALDGLDYDFGDSRNILVLEPENEMELVKETTDLLEPGKFEICPAETPLHEVWRRVYNGRIAGLLAFNGQVFPEMWMHSGLSCVDIKTKFEPQPYERHFWLPGYRLVADDPEILRKWRQFVPDDIECTTVKDIINLWLK